MASATQFSNIGTETVNIATDLSDKEYFAVNYSADNTVAIAADATKVPYILVEGVDGSSAADIGTIAPEGSYKFKLGGTVAVGDKLTSDSAGKWIKTITDKDNYGAVAKQAGVADDIVEGDINRGMISAT